ncbi:hypothetical protein VP01_132g7 [Puccinia sorghi]|uniref:Uncharacterized protein n=1 Tax=Puccinia sorghi TaxID=27349 RepID=A0A0L6VMN1_9BASI|nr:hypothetical protein VP01_132g7 [Puccinia sorghi]
MLAGWFLNPPFYSPVSIPSLLFLFFYAFVNFLKKTPVGHPDEAILSKLYFNLLSKTSLNFCASPYSCAHLFIFCFILPHKYKFIQQTNCWFGDEYKTRLNTTRRQPPQNLCPPGSPSSLSCRSLDLKGTTQTPALIPLLLILFLSFLCSFLLLYMITKDLWDMILNMPKKKPTWKTYSILFIHFAARVTRLIWFLESRRLAAHSFRSSPKYYFSKQVLTIRVKKPCLQEGSPCRHFSSFFCFKYALIPHLLQLISIYCLILFECCSTRRNLILGMKFFKYIESWLEIFYRKDGTFQSIKCCVQILNFKLRMVERPSISDICSQNARTIGKKRNIKGLSETRTNSLLEGLSKFSLQNVKRPFRRHLFYYYRYIRV